MTTPFLKTVLPSAYDFGEPTAALVDVHSRGIDDTWMRKRAAAGIFRDVELKPESGKSVIHLIAMGATGRYSLNRNGDGFLRKGGVEITAPHPKKGYPPTRLINRGLIDTHDTFQKHAHVFRHHLNRDPEKNEGEVIKSGYHDIMDRVELLIKVANDKWAEDIQDLADGRDLDFSMSCTLDPTYPVMTEEGYKQIVDVKEGDKVATHTNTWKRVKVINRRKYTGKVVKLHMDVDGFPPPLELTIDHLMMTSAGWIHAKHLKEGDELLCGRDIGCYEIKKIERRLVIDAQTYNLEVEEDESYLLAGMISHNCKVPFDVCTICLNKARGRDEYCDHARNHMGEITKEGHHVGVMNDWMDFFDISKVTARADRIALGLLKAASGKIKSGAELAEEIELFPPPGPKFTLLDPVGPDLDKKAVLGKLSDIEKEIEATSDADSPLTRLSMSFHPEVSPPMGGDMLRGLSVPRGQAMDLLGGLADARVSLPLNEFMKIILDKRHGDVESVMGEARMLVPGIFGRMRSQPGCMADMGDFELGRGILPRPVREMIGKLVPSHSLGDEPVRRRITIMVLRGKPAPELMKSAELAKSGSCSKLAQRIAQAYAMYKIAFCQRVGLENSVLTKLAVMQHYIPELG
jgi:hypothetical protein